MGLIKTLSFIQNHPLASKAKSKAFLAFINWQVNQLLLTQPVLMPFINDSVLLVEKGMTGATGNVYTGLHEFEEMSFLLHFLRKEDVFYDVGANVGAFTILASKVIGAKSFAFEPSASTYNKLLRNLFLNNIMKKVEAINMGVGSKEGAMYFTEHLDTTNHIVDQTNHEAIQIEVTTLDKTQKEYNIQPTMIKIDVEGFETEVIKGGKEVLKDQLLKVVIMELNGSGNRYGFDEEKVHQEMLSNQFKAYHYSPFKRVLIPRKNRSKHGNTIYIRDKNHCISRIESAPLIEKFGISF